MNEPNPRPASQLALINATHGRDAHIAAAMLREAGIDSETCDSLADLAGALGSHITFVVIAEEELLQADLTALARWIDAQPPWSDLPFIVLTRHGGGLERNPSAARLSEVLGHVSFLERPFHPTTFISVARAALRNRQRQYENRSNLAALHEAQERLDTALQAGRLGTWELQIATGTLLASDTCKAVFGHPARRCGNRGGNRSPQ